MKKLNVLVIMAWALVFGMATACVSKNGILAKIPAESQCSQPLGGDDYV
jgi:hypothetical protein